MLSDNCVRCTANPKDTLATIGYVRFLCLECMVEEISPSLLSYVKMKLIKSGLFTSVEEIDNTGWRHY